MRTIPGLLLALTLAACSDLHLKEPEGAFQWATTSISTVSYAVETRPFIKDGYPATWEIIRFKPPHDATIREQMLLTYWNCQDRTFRFGDDAKIMGDGKRVSNPETVTDWWRPIEDEDTREQLEAACGQKPYAGATYPTARQAFAAIGSK